MKILEKHNVYISGDGGYHTYRIPSVIRTKSGALLAFCEGRKESRHDSGFIEIMVKKSHDMGRTWTPPRVVASDGKNTFGNCNPVLDEKTGRVHVVCNFNLAGVNEEEIRRGEGIRGCYHLFSDDEGNTWSAPRDITKYAKKPEWSWHAIGPCHGIQTKNGRFVFGGNHANLSNATTAENYDGYSFSIYSDDDCDTFDISPDIAPETNECSVAQLSDGRLYMNMRTQQHFHRFIAYSENGGAAWNDFSADKNLTDPKCQGSVLALNGTGTLAFCNAASFKRSHLTLRLSHDFGKTWTESILIHEGPAAYSDLVQIDDETIGCLYESGTVHPYENISYVLIRI